MSRSLSERESLIAIKLRDGKKLTKSELAFLALDRRPVANSLRPPEEPLRRRRF
jgi:hypothetical protein